MHRAPATHAAHLSLEESWTAAKADLMHEENVRRLASCGSDLDRLFPQLSALYYQPGALTDEQRGNLGFLLVECMQALAQKDNGGQALGKYLGLMKDFARHRDDQVRLKGIIGVFVLKEVEGAKPEVLGTLESALSDSNVGNRLLAGYALCRGNPSYREATRRALREALDAGATKLCIDPLEVIRVLGPAGDGFLPEIVAELDKPGADFRRIVSVGVGAVTSETTHHLELCRALLRADDPRKVRLGCVLTCIIGFAPESIRTDLQPLLFSRNPLIRSSAERAWAEVQNTPEVVPLQRFVDRSGVIREVCRAQPREASPLVNAICDLWESEFSTHTESSLLNVILDRDYRVPHGYISFVMPPAAHLLPPFRWMITACSVQIRLLSTRSWWRGPTAVSALRVSPYERRLNSCLIRFSSAILSECPVICAVIRPCNRRPSR